MPERADVARRLREHDVAGVEEDAGDQVERLLAADGDHHVVRRAGDADQRHHVADLLAQPRIALAGAVVQRDGALVSDQLVEQRADRVERQGGGVRRAAGEAHHLRAARDGEESSDLRCGHAPGAERVTTGIRVERCRRHAFHGNRAPARACRPAATGRRRPSGRLILSFRGRTSCSRPCGARAFAAFFVSGFALGMVAALLSPVRAGRVAR